MYINTRVPVCDTFYFCSFFFFLSPHTGADLDGYRLLVKTHPGGFAEPTPEDFKHKHSLPDEPSGWGDVIQVNAQLHEVMELIEFKLKKQLRRKAAAKELVVGDGGDGALKSSEEKIKEKEKRPTTSSNNQEEMMEEEEEEKRRNNHHKDKEEVQEEENW